MLSIWVLAAAAAAVEATAEGTPAAVAPVAVIAAQSWGNPAVVALLRNQ
jgi:hypothetical protein